MPVAFNPPPLPTHDSMAPIHKSSNRDEGDDAFASMLAVAGLAKVVADPKTKTREIDPVDATGAVPAALCLLPPVPLRPDPAVSTRGLAPEVDLTDARAKALAIDDSALVGLDGARPIQADALRSARAAPESPAARHRPNLDSPAQTQNQAATTEREPKALALDRAPAPAPIDAATRSMATPLVQTPPADISESATQFSERAKSATSLTTKAADKREAAANEVQVLSATAANAPAPSAITAPSPQSAAMAVTALNVSHRTYEPAQSGEITARVGSPAWTDEAAQKIAHIVIGQNDRAELRVHPAELGPIEIRVDLKADQATVSIVATHPDTRHALEQALPQLRDLLAQGGITLSQASVHDGAAQRQDAPPERARAPIIAPEVPTSTHVDTSSGSLPSLPAHRLVDVFV